MMTYGNLYNADVTSPFSGGVDYLEPLRNEIAEDDGGSILKGIWYPSIYSLKMISESQFHCTFLIGEDPVTAEDAGDGTYQILYVGGIELIQFEESTTLTKLEIDWCADAENWKTIKFDAPEGCTLTVTTMTKRGYYTPDVLGRYHLQQGIYIVTVTDEYSNVATEKILIRGSGNVHIHAPIREEK